MASFRNPEDVRAYVTEKVNAAATQRLQLATFTGICASYYEGVQYLNTSAPSYVSGASNGNLMVNPNLDKGKLRVVWNEMTRRIIKVASATWPSSLDMTVNPPLRDSGIEKEVYAQVHEDMVTGWCRKAGFLAQSRNTNFQRCLNGRHGLILTMRSATRSLDMGGGPVDMQDMELGVEPLHPIRLILDPFCPHRDLNLHTEVIYGDVWTAAAIRRAFPSLKFEDSDLKTVGQLTPYEQDVNRFSSGRLFSRYRYYSETKGARVYQIYRKDQAGLWSTMYSAVQIGDRDWQVPNMDDPSSPFGCQKYLPMVLLGCHPRADSPWDFSDVSMAKDSQDILNLTYTTWFRVFQKYAGTQWVVDRRWMGKKVSDEDLKDKFSNTVGGIIPGDPSSGDRYAQPPQMVNTPAPDPRFLEMADRAGNRLRDNGFRNEQDSGLDIRTHVPNATYQAAAQNSGQVLGIRVAEDLDCYEQLLCVVDGTLTKMVQNGSPSALGMLREEGFDEQDIGIILNSDSQYPNCGIELAESAIRYRSTDEKRANLMEMANSAVIAMPAPKLFKALADLDVPVTDDDRHMRQELTKAVARTLQGEPWVPLPLGDYTDWCLAYLRNALLDKAARRNPQIQQLIAQAITQQTQFGMQEKIASDPNLYLQQQQQQAEAQQAQMDAQMQAQQGQQEEADENTQQPPANVGEMLDQMAAPAA